MSRCGAAMKRVDHAEAASKFIEAKDHVEFHDKRLWDLRKKRDRESERPARMGAAARAGVGDQGAHAVAPRRLPRAVRAQRHRQRHGRALGARRRRAQPDRATTSCSRTASTRWSRASRCSPRSARCGRSWRTAASRSSRPTSASASSSSTTSRRATSSCRRCTSCAATSPRCSVARSAPIPRNHDMPLSGREPAPAHAAVLPRARRPA